MTTYLILPENKYRDLEIISSLQIDYVTYFSNLPNLLACKSHINYICDFCTPKNKQKVMNGKNNFWLPY